MAKILLTRAGYEELLKELELLSNVERPRVVQEILEDAPAWGAERDDPDFQRVLARRQMLERRIEQLQQLLANAEVQVGSNLPPDQVRFNARVTILSLNSGREREFRLVSPVEADALKGRLSMLSPLGRALMGRARGDRVELDTPSGRRAYQILEIDTDGV